LVIYTQNDIEGKCEMKKLLNEMQQAKLKELQLQQAKLNELQAELETLNTKVVNHEPITPQDTQFISNLGWISTLSISIAAIAASL
jgi:uncharacterized protein YlxW (UPF0749 family)